MQINYSKIAEDLVSEKEIEFKNDKSGYAERKELGKIIYFIIDNNWHIRYSCSSSILNTINIKYRVVSIQQRRFHNGIYEQGCLYLYYTINEYGDIHDDLSIKGLSLNLIENECTKCFENKRYVFKFKDLVDDQEHQFQHIIDTILTIPNTSTLELLNEFFENYRNSDDVYKPQSDTASKEEDYITLKNKIDEYESIIKSLQQILNRISIE